jgi:hypothetical protein
MRESDFNVKNASCFYAATEIKEYFGKEIFQYFRRCFVSKIGFGIKIFFLNSLLRGELFFLK